MLPPPKSAGALGVCAAHQRRVREWGRGPVLVTRALGEVSRADGLRGEDWLA